MNSNDYFGIFVFASAICIAIMEICEYHRSKTYSTSLPTPSKIPPMPICKPSKKQEECTKCGRSMSRYWKELED